MRQVEIACTLHFQNQDFSIRGKGHTVGLESDTFTLRGQFNRDRRTVQAFLRCFNAV